MLESWLPFFCSLPITLKFYLFPADLWILRTWRVFPGTWTWQRSLASKTTTVSEGNSVGTSNASVQIQVWSIKQYFLLFNKVFDLICFCVEKNINDHPCSNSGGIVRRSRRSSISYQLKQLLHSDRHRLRWKQAKIYKKCKTIFTKNYNLKWILIQKLWFATVMRRNGCHFE